MKYSCIVCSNNLSINNNQLNYCIKCGSSYDKYMNFIPSRHNWNLQEFSKNFDIEKKLSDSKHQN